MKINLSGPDITQKEIDAAAEVIKSGVLSIGPKLREFEEKFKELLGVKHAIGVNSGTSGLHLLLKSIGIDEGDEVITTPFSFIASTNCILFQRAKPVFVDIDPLTLNINADKIEEAITPRTKAILPVDVFGQPVNMVKIKKIGGKYGLRIIEDSCEAIGSEYLGIKTGTVGDGSVFAFYPNKQITTAEGGIIVTNDDDIANMCRSMRNQGRGEECFTLNHERLGYNYRLSEIHAAIGVVQMERLSEIIKKRQKVADMYNERLKDVAGITIPYIHPEVTNMSWFVYVIQADKGIDRDKVMNYLRENGIGTRQYFPPIHMQPYIKAMYGFKEDDFPISYDIGNRSMALPFYNNIKEEEVDYVVEKLKEAIGAAAK